MEDQTQSFGKINWADLTTSKTQELKVFYQDVFGWTAEPIPMKDGEEAYEDYVMKSSDGSAVGGICNARGSNLGVPPQWMLYITVENVEGTVKKVKLGGGKLVKEYRNKHGELIMAMLEDPAGAVFGIAKPY